MRRTGILVAIAATTLVSASMLPFDANAGVLITTFRFKLCVTGAKHPDGCKDVGADAHVVVSDDTMDVLDGEIGQGATITQIPPKGSLPASAGQERRRKRSQQ